jgi:hypothetical protein
MMDRTKCGQMRAEQEEVPGWGTMQSRSVTPVSDRLLAHRTPGDYAYIGTSWP